MSKYWWIGALIVVVLAGVVIWKQQPTTVIPVVQNIPQPSATPLPSFPPSPSDTPAQTPDSASVPGSVKSTAGGPPAISCTYTVPATAVSYGTAKIDSTWEGLVVGSTGKTKVQVCVSASGKGPQEMSSDARSSGTKTDTAAFLSQGTNYTFTLFDEHGGDSLDCNGGILATCQLNVPAQPTPRPAKTR